MEKIKQRRFRPGFVFILIIVFGAALIYGGWRLNIVATYPVKQTAMTTRQTWVSANHFMLGQRQAKAGQTIRIKRYYLMGRFGKQRVVAQVELRGGHYYVLAKTLQLGQANRINAYIARQGYPHQAITKDIDPQFSRQHYQTLWHHPRGVIVHDTGTENTTVASEYNYMKRNYANSGVFVHTFIGARQILNIANVHDMAQGAGPAANPYYVQFEMPHQYTAHSFAMQLANAAYYTARILRDNGLALTPGGANRSGTVWTHALVSTYLGGTDHRDPNAYWQTSADQLFATTYDLNDFIQLVQAYYNRID